MDDGKVTPSSNSIDVNGLVALYIELRDGKAALKAQHEEAMKPFNDGMTELEAILLKHLEDMNAKNIKTASGTVSQRIFRSATVKDRKAFREFVLANEAYDLADWRPAKVAVFDYMEKQGVEIPGVNTSAYMTIGVRKGDAPEQED